MTALQTITLPKPDDWHVHLRDGPLLKAVLPFTARQFGRAVVMPNLKPPVVAAAQARAYRERIRKALPPGLTFTPLMTAYLTDSTDPDDLTRGFEEELFFAAKLYPAGVTTNSESGVTDLKNIAPIFEKLQRIGMPLLIHGEVGDEDVDFFDREAVFVDRVLIPLRKSFPGLKMVMEHVTTAKAAAYVAEEGRSGLLGATITPHHLLLSRNALFEGGIRPHHFCLPVLKREEDRKALIRAATSGGAMFFAGTDSAPHPRVNKESAKGSGGVFCAPRALAVYADVFEKAGALNKLTDFLSLNGAAFYNQPISTTTIALERHDVPDEPPPPVFAEDGTEITPFPAETPLFWRVRGQEQMRPS